ncbi:hypothetical protein B9Z65_6244 [Elsinoe australis]|uniref:SUN domain-containing protein n=1 Tax=Elsinoe australis TaxID=40998 RepID=A0A2P8A838_9PEZI|nr:hypothetical protein B9Z65_6244 [Elsinoe australis]
MRLLFTLRCLNLLGLISAEIALIQAGSTGATQNKKETVISPAPTCRSGSVNYITHKLPQLCALSNRTALAHAHTPTSGTNLTASSASTTATPAPTQQDSVQISTPSEQGRRQESTTQAISISASDSPASSSQISAASSSAPSSPQSTITASPGAAVDGEETPLDTANFLSFEEWKKQNLEKVGQSPEHVGQHRAAEDIPKRPRPGNSNALDVLGEDTEIELDFGGFGAGTGPQAPVGQSRGGQGQQQQGQGVSEKPPSQQTLRSKDAGRTCKERTNYASFDCAATILKTNKECKSASSVLVENKDSYMLNICSVKNKFFIVELCDDILIDTVVLANYEFFSSIFRTFRLSVSDRYPAKPDKWRELGVYEARNTREVQPFLVEQSLIWARYLRIEILSHYGNEYYCPVSLLRVHGTTMIEEFRHQEEIARGEYPEEIGMEESEAGTASPVPPQEPPESSVAADKSAAETPVNQPTVASAAQTTSSVIDEQQSISGTSQVTDSVRDSPRESQTADKIEHVDNHTMSMVKEVGLQYYVNATDVVTSRPVAETSVTPSYTSIRSTNCSPAAASPTEQPAQRQQTRQSESHASTTDVSTVSQAPVDHKTSASTTIPSNTSTATASHTSTDSGSPQQPSSASSSAPSSSSQTISSSPPPSQPQNPSPSVSTDGSSQAAPQQPQQSQQPQAPPSHSRRPTSTHPSPSTPSTQESFFKSLHKRLSALESNATLSLQYIEHQSLLLRDAFLSHSKSQSSRTSSFLSSLNTTVRSELLDFRKQYDELWQSTVIELEGQRRQFEKEMGEMRRGLEVLGREAVWQKRMVVVQSTLLLGCLGLVLFGRQGGTGGGWEGRGLKVVGWGSPPLSPKSPTLGGKSPVLEGKRGWGWRRSPSPSPLEGARGEKEGEDGVSWKVSPPTPMSGSLRSFEERERDRVGDEGGSEEEASGSGSGESERTDEFEDSADMEDVRESVEGEGMDGSGVEQTPKKVPTETQSSPATPTGTRDVNPVAQVMGDVQGNGEHGVISA